MAEPAEFQFANFTMAAPKGLEDEIKDLHVHMTTGGMWSCWRLDEEELKRVNETGCVWLFIAAHTMHPVVIDGIGLQFQNQETGEYEPVRIEPPMPKAKDKKND